jgi:hypothetical protein
VRGLFCILLVSRYKKFVFSTEKKKNYETSCNEFCVKNYIKKSIFCIKQRWNVQYSTEETNVGIMKQKSEMDEKSSFLNICPEACCRKLWGGGGLTHLLPPTHHPIPTSEMSPYL